MYLPFLSEIPQKNIAERSEIRENSTALCKKKSTEPSARNVASKFVFPVTYREQLDSTKVGLFL